MNDPKHFKDPEIFNPYRFIDQNGQFVKDERLVIYSLGKRICMGELFARKDIFMFTANLIQKMRLLPALNHPLPDRHNYTINFTCIPRDFYMRFQPVE